MLRTLLLSSAFIASLATTVSAASVVPVEYQMQNGQGSGIGGTYSYRDESYDGPGAPVGSELANLTGGTGDLTDGFIATANWNSTNSQTGATPYVGWFSIDPRITFLFDQSYDFNAVTFHFDASYQGGVAPPAGVEVNNSFISVVSGPVSGAPFAHTIDLSGVAPTDTLSFDIFSQSNRWVFMSEVTFDAAAPVPLPASGLLLIGAVGGLAAWRRKRA